MFLRFLKLSDNKQEHTSLTVCTAGFWESYHSKDVLDFIFYYLNILFSTSENGIKLLLFLNVPKFSVILYIPVFLNYTLLHLSTYSECDSSWYDF